jgi:hypothetical protein
MAKSPTSGLTGQVDTKGKEVGDAGIKMHKKLAMDEKVETGAGAGPMGGKNPQATRP